MGLVKTVIENKWPFLLWQAVLSIQHPGQTNSVQDGTRCMQVSHVDKDMVEQSHTTPQSICKQYLNHPLGLTLSTTSLVLCLFQFTRFQCQPVPLGLIGFKTKGFGPGLDNEYSFLKRSSGSPSQFLMWFNYCSRFCISDPGGVSGDLARDAISLMR